MSVSTGEQTGGVVQLKGWYGNIKYCVSVSLTREQASVFLSRPRRAYQVFEETKQGHLERECVEERCSKEEALDIQLISKKATQLKLLRL